MSVLTLNLIALLVDPDLSLKLRDNLLQSLILRYEIIVLLFDNFELATFTMARVLG